MNEKISFPAFVAKRIINELMGGLNKAEIDEKDFFRHRYSAKVFNKLCKAFYDGKTNNKVFKEDVDWLIETIKGDLNGNPDYASIVICELYMSM